MKRGREQSARVAAEKAREERRLAEQREAEARRRRVPVNPGRLGPNHSYGVPAFVERGYYVDLPFRCKDCGSMETWRAAQQKWWYEIAKGDPWTTAVRCRSCRRKERRRRESARETHLNR